MRFGLFLLLAGALSAQPIHLHPANPHYYEFNGKTTVLITSGEHYGAVLNTAFNQIKYLDTLAADGLNLTRVFPGSYAEVPGDFVITKNTLAPDRQNFLTPYPRTKTPGALDGGMKYDVAHWNDAYFARLKNYVAEAGKRGIVVEVVLFNVFYNDGQWNRSPWNPANNVNSLPEAKRTEVLTMKHGRFVELEKALVEKTVTELNAFDNVIYEICNEPYFARDIPAVGKIDEWQAMVAATVAELEKSMPKQHLIAQNLANGNLSNFSLATEHPVPGVSVLNFHYARPEAVAYAQSAQPKAVVAYDESGFDGTTDATYRIPAWSFLLSGGGHFNNLDYSFIAGNEDGTFGVPGNSPGWGSPSYRKQLKVLADFLRGFDLVRMKPAEPNKRVFGAENGSSTSGSAFELSIPGEQYAFYMHSAVYRDGLRPKFAIETTKRTVAISAYIPTGSYRVRWIDPKTGTILQEEVVFHSSTSGPLRLQTPIFTEDLALSIRREL